MTFKDFGSFDHILINGIDELVRKNDKYKHFNYHKGGANYLTVNLTATDKNTTKTAFLMTVDDLPEQINPYELGFCFLDNKFEEVSNKSFFICKIDDNNRILESKHYYHYSHFLKVE